MGIGQLGALLGISGLPTKSNNEVLVGIVSHGERSGTLIRRVLNICTTGDVVLVVVDTLGAAHKVRQGRISASQFKVLGGFGSELWRWESKGSSGNNSRQSNKERRDTHICDEAEFSQDKN